MIPSWENMAEWGKDPYSDIWHAENEWYANPGLQRSDTSASSDTPLVQTAGLQNGNGWTEAFKHAALAGSLGAVGGLVLGPLGAVGGLLTALVMSSSVLQSHAREIAQLNRVHTSTRSKTREDEERRNRERLERERREKVREMQRARRQEEWRQKREQEWDSFVADKKTVATNVLRRYGVHVVNVTVVGRSKAIVEVPWHLSWQLRRQLVDILESALQMRVAFIAVRFCDGCGGKLVGPTAGALQCPLCGRRFFDVQLPAQVVHEKPQHTRRETTVAPKPAIVNPDLIEREKKLKSGKIEPVPTVQSIMESNAESANFLVEHQAWDPIEVEDYQARMELEAVDQSKIMQHLLETKPKTPLPPSPPKTTAEKTMQHIPPTETEMSPTTTTPAPAKPAASQGGIEVGKHVQISGPYKGLSGKVQLVDKKKRKATVLLDHYGTTVNVAIELVAPLEVLPQ